MIKGGQLKILSSDEILDIHLATLDVLENTGVVVQEKTAFSLLKDSGAYVDEDNMLVRIPSHLVEEAIRKAPRGFTLYARNPKHNRRIEGRRVCFQPMIGRINIIDLETGRRRRTSISDLENLIKLADALENYHILHSGAMMPHIDGVQDAIAHAYGYYIGVKNSEKVVKGTGRGKVKAKDCIRLAAILAGGEEELRKRPNIFTTCNPVSPLRHAKEQTEGIIEYGRYRLPVDITSEPQAGATAPVTLAGLLVQQNAEILSGITIAQLANPGTPVMYGVCGTIMDMRVGTIALGAIEAGLINVAGAQMAQYYNLPSRGTGGSTESKLLDVQAGYEKALTLSMAAMAGANVVFYPGVLDHASAISLESLLIDNEICGMIIRALEGIEVDEFTLATSVMAKVGPGGHYLGQRHTIDYLQKEHFIPKLSDRAIRERWEEAGSKDLRDVAKEQVRHILKEHQPAPLDRDVDKMLLETIREIEKRELKS
jgi:trimethylamine--corrinoid protein Co-methyltransferase